MKIFRFLAVFLTAFLLQSMAASAQIWINEFHYDNASTDAGEFIELAIRTGFVDLNTVTVTLYNGSGGAAYLSHSGSEFTQGGSENGVSFFYLDIAGIQNGPDGISLDVDGELIQFISYEGNFIASGGPANGVRSTDIGVAQTSATPEGSSLSLTGLSSNYDGFTWSVTDNNATKGQVNAGQEIEETISEIDEPTIFVSLNGAEIDSGATIDFGQILLQETSTQTLEIKNLGNDTLFITGLNFTDGAFSSTVSATDSLTFNESLLVEITFEPTLAGSSTGVLSFNSNDTSNTAFSFNLTGSAIDGDGVMDISEARTLAQGTTVTVSGIVTVADEFRGPVYFQDATAGLAWYDADMRETGTDDFLLDVQRGDSIVVTGALSNFYELLQISDPNVQFEVHRNPATTVEPIQITIAQLNSGDFEGQLVSVEAKINTGVLQANANYSISVGTDTAQLRIDKYSALAGSAPPAGSTTIVGVVGRFNEVFQITPRGLEDITVEPKVYPDEGVSKDVTFEIVTWNIERFGDTGNGEAADEIQLNNAITVIDSLDADVVALQEISDDATFYRLVDSLDAYSGALAPAANLAFLYKNETIVNRGISQVDDGLDSYDWASRFPYRFKFNANINGETRTFYVFNIHAKAFGDEESYLRRVDASVQMKNYLDLYHPNDNVILLGDFNDEILGSTYNGVTSPYSNFDNDEDYTIITKSLEEEGFTSYSSYSMLDHIVFSNDLMDEYYEGTERIEIPSYISSYLSQTSDHYPVWVRLQWGTISPNEEQNEPVRFLLEQNYPNPFNPATVISYQLPASSLVSLDVFDMTGRKVATLVNGQVPAGEHQVTFNAASLSSGMYMYRLQAGTQIMTKKMMLVK